MSLTVRLEPSSTLLECQPGAPLSQVLAQHGVEFPCGGTGECGGCRVRLLSGSLAVSEQDSNIFSAGDLAAGWRLACQARPQESIVIECGQWQMDVLADDTAIAATGRHGLGIAIDLGTTTLVAQLLDLATGSILAVETGLNPQAAFGSDVMSRLRAALTGADLAGPLRLALGQMIDRLVGSRTNDVVDVVLVGNTVMHHLFCGLDPAPLAATPFHSANLGEQCFRPRQLAWLLPISCRIRFLRCIGGFVGSDILAGIHAVGMPHAERPIALMDLGTNGEIAVGNRDRILCASTAAGPAFEAGAIRMGMRATAGAISRVLVEQGTLAAFVIGGGPALGICGSGLVDAIAAGLRTDAIQPNGRITLASRALTVQSPVILYQSDVRELQLAKAAVASGLRLLLRGFGIKAGDLAAVHLAGAFGNYVRVESAVAIGLIEAAGERILPAGNTALRGAKQLLLAGDEPSLPPIEHISLASDPAFEDEYIACMGFPASQTAIVQA